MINYFPVLLVLLMVLSAVLGRRWIRVRKEDGGVDKPRTNLRALQAMSWLMVITGFVLLIVSRLEDKKPEGWLFFVIFAGIVGAFCHRGLASLEERVSRMENQEVTCTPETVPQTEREPTMGRNDS